MSTTDTKHLLEVAERIWTRSESGDLYAAHALNASDRAAMSDVIAAEAKLLRLDHEDRADLDRRDPLWIVGVFRGTIERDQRRRDREERAAQVRTDMAEELAAIKPGSAPATWGDQIRAFRYRKEGN
jgi:hypothetical protein